MTLLCHRCGAELTPGKGDFYEVHIEAFADPYPPVIPAEQPGEDRQGKLQYLAAQLMDKSERELLDQVHRRLVIHLCWSCYQHWIENPAG